MKGGRRIGSREENIEGVKEDESKKQGGDGEREK